MKKRLYSMPVLHTVELKSAILAGSNMDGVNEDGTPSVGTLDRDDEETGQEEQE